MARVLLWIGRRQSHMTSSTTRDQIRWTTTGGRQWQHRLAAHVLARIRTSGLVAGGPAGQLGNHEVSELEITVVAAQTDATLLDRGAMATVIHDPEDKAAVLVQPDDDVINCIVDNCSLDVAPRVIPDPVLCLSKGVVGAAVGVTASDLLLDNDGVVAPVDAGRVQLRFVLESEKDVGPVPSPGRRGPRRGQSLIIELELHRDSAEVGPSTRGPKHR